jgi:hypothetical protein
MPAFRKLVVRDDTTVENTTTTRLIIALVALALSGLLLAGLLFVLRAVRRRKAPKDELTGFGGGKQDSYRRLTIDIQSQKSSYVEQEKRDLIENSSSPPPSPLPEIRITFPDELDRNGRPRPQSGRVVVVRMGENNVYGLEPLNDPAPPYQQANGQRMQSLDLNRMGGLKEKEYA